MRLAVTASRKGGMQIWEADSDTEAGLGVEVCSLEGHRDTLSRVVFSSCGRYIAPASEDRAVRLWRTGHGGDASAALAARFSEYKVEVRQVAFSADGKTLWSGAIDGTVVTRRICDILLQVAVE